MMKFLDNEETKYSSRIDSIENYSNEDDSSECFSDSISENLEENSIQKVPILSCSPTKVQTENISQTL